MGQTHTSEFDIDKIKDLKGNTSSLEYAKFTSNNYPILFRKYVNCGKYNAGLIVALVVTLVLGGIGFAVLRGIYKREIDILLNPKKSREEKAKAEAKKKSEKKKTATTKPQVQQPVVVQQPVQQTYPVAQPMIQPQPQRYVTMPVA